MQDTFRNIADRTAAITGSPWTFVASVVLTALWLILGPVFRFSDTWQLTMNTLASQATFLVAFLLQNTARRSRRASRRWRSAKLEPSRLALMSSPGAGETNCLPRAFRWIDGPSAVGSVVALTTTNSVAPLEKCCWYGI